VVPTQCETDDRSLSSSDSEKIGAVYYRDSPLDIKVKKKKRCQSEYKPLKLINNN